MSTIIFAVPQDPTDLVMQGEQMRQSVMDSPVGAKAQIENVSTTAAGGLTSLVADEDSYPPMNSFIDGNRLGVRRSKDGILQIRDGAGVMGPGGNWVYNDWCPLINPALFATNTFTLSGVTKDSTGAALANCRVVALESGRVASGQSPVVGETTSDGSGNYTLPVGGNMAHQLIAYKPGSPDVAGITRNDVIPVG